nr:TPA_asm: ND2 [Bombus soroeensis]
MFIYKLQIFMTMTSLILFYIIFSTSSIFIKWLSMEFITIMLISLLNIKSENKSPSITYFLYSSIASLFTIIVISLNYTQLFMIKDNTINNLMIIILNLKIGLFPFYYWMIFIYKSSSWKQIYILSTLLKFIPIYFFSSLIYLSTEFLIMLSINMIFISLYTNINFSIKKLLGCSSIFNSILFIMIAYINKPMFFMMMSIYMIMLYLLIYILNYYNIENLNFNNMSNNSIYILFISIFMYSSFPMFISFMIKWEFMFYININYSNNILMLLMLTNMIMMWNYFSLFKFLIMKFNLHKKNNKMKIPLKLMFSFILIMYSLMFLLFNLI